MCMQTRPCSPCKSGAGLKASPTLSVPCTTPSCMHPGFMNPDQFSGSISHSFVLAWPRTFWHDMSFALQGTGDLPVTC